MTVHLHLHLEPGLRKSRQLKHAWRTAGSRDEFFSMHEVSEESPRISLEDLVLFLSELHNEQQAEGVHYAELRFSPRRFWTPRSDLSRILSVASSKVTEFRSPRMRLILLINRDSPQEFVDACEDAIGSGLPEGFAGLDLAGDEVKFPDVGRFEKCFSKASRAGFGITVHAGEFGSERNIWLALDRLGARRIGHGVSAGCSHTLAARLAREDVLIESCISSNVVLGAVPTIDAHPLRWLVDQGVAASINTDVPMYLGVTMPEELGHALRLLGNDDRVLAHLALAAERHAFTSVS